MKDKNFRQNIFEFAFIVLAVKNVLDSSSLLKRPDIVDTLLIIIFLGFIFWKLALQTYSWMRIVVFAVFWLLSIYTCIKGNYFYLIFTFLGTIAMQDVEIKEVVKKTSTIKIILILIHVLASLFFLVFMPEKVETIVRNGVTRYGFMLGHPNTFSMYVLWTSMEFIYARYEKLRIPKLLIIWFINAFTYLITNSNTSIIVSTITIALIIFEKCGKEKAISFVKPVSKYAFLVCSIAFPLIIASYTKLSGGALSLFNTLDKMFTGRLLYGAYAYDEYGFTLLGRTIWFSSKTYWRGHWFDTIIFDNSYIWMFIIYGYLYLIIISIGFILISKRTTTLEKILLIGFTVYGIMEAYIINASICFPLFFIGKYIYVAIKDKKEKKLSKILRNG